MSKKLNDISGHGPYLDHLFREIELFKKDDTKFSSVGQRARERKRMRREYRRKCKIEQSKRAPGDRSPARGRLKFRPLGGCQMKRRRQYRRAKPTPRVFSV